MIVRQPTLCCRSLMLKATLPVGCAADESTARSYMEKRGSWRVISNTWNWVLTRTKRTGWRENESGVVNCIRKRLITRRAYLVLPPTKALMCRSTGISFGGTMGTLTQPDRLWALGWTTWLSPSNMPSAKMSTARITVSVKDQGETQQLIRKHSINGETR